MKFHAGLAILTSLLVAHQALGKGPKGVRAVRKLRGPPPDKGEDLAGNSLAAPILYAEDRFGDVHSPDGNPLLNTPLTAFKFGNVPDPPSDFCLVDDDVPPVSEDEFCYVNATTIGGIAWLQRSDRNKWGGWVIPSTYYFDDPIDDTFVVSGADVGDRLESPEGEISASKTRVEVSLFQTGLPERSDFDFGDGAGTPQAVPMYDHF